MAHRIGDLIKEQASTSGTTTFTLSGALAGFRPFSAMPGGWSTGDTTWYCARNGDEWETGLGTKGAGSTLARTTIINSSNADAVVAFSAPPVVYCIVPAAQISLSSAPRAHAFYQAVALEPDAIEAVQKDTFSYVVASTETKLVLASWQTRLGATGRMEVRNPFLPTPLRGVTLNGIAAGAAAIIVDPSKASYVDAEATYHDRMRRLYELPTRVLPITGQNLKLPFLPGPYGAIITQYTCFDLTWLALRPFGTSGSIGLNFDNEISDTSIQRVGTALTLAVNKRCASEVHSGTGASGTGAICYVLLPSDWSSIPDPLTYTFRDDFMAAALNTGVWTRAQSTAGNVEIDSTYQWLKIFGNGTWGANGLFRTATEARVAGKSVTVDVYVPQNIAASGGSCMVGWSDGLGQNYANFAHAVNFSGTVINVFENGTARGTVGAGYTVGAIYRVRVTLTAGGAVYEIQGGTEYPVIGGSTWTTITPATTASATTTLTPGATAWNGNGYISDFRVR